MPSEFLTAFAGATLFRKKRESDIAPFIRTANMAEQKQKEAYQELHMSIEELNKLIEEKKSENE